MVKSVRLEGQRGFAPTKWMKHKGKPTEWQYCLLVALGIKASIAEHFYIIAFSH